MKSFLSFIVFSLVLSGVFAAEQVNFLSKPLTAGKASLAENGYIVSQTIGTANFSPELRLPIQLIYDSSNEKTGIFGFAWSSPQLESSAYYDKGGVLWTTPWGEKIKFFPKDQKDPKDAIKIELYELAKKGRGFFAPYSEWEANTSNTKYTDCGNWVFTGRRKYEGWKFVYRDATLRSITAPSGRSLRFSYTRNRITTIAQNDQAFIEVSYADAGNQVERLTVNGIEHKLSYKNGKLVILPKTASGSVVNASRPQLSSIKTGDLNPAGFAYDDYGFLNQVQQGDFIDALTVQHQTLAERQAELGAQKDRKLKYSGPINGRLLADVLFKYKYSGREPGTVKLTNQRNQTADYNYDQKTGIFKINEFSGKSYSIYYFMRYDVAYLGKVRKIMDGRGRDVVNYRYDKLTGNVLRVRDMAENDTNFSYYPNGELNLITRRAADQDKPEPVTGFVYDQKNNPTAISRLDAQGNSVVTTKISYNANNQPVYISNGQTQTNVSYNNFGYPTSIRNVFGQANGMQFDKFNRLEKTTDIYGAVTSYSYTPAGLVAKIERHDGKELLSSLSVAYNGNGQPVSYSDQAGRTKKFERDAFGRVVKELFPDETSVEYEYNKIGQLDTVLDQNQHKIKFNWSKFGLDKKTTAANQLTDYVYDKYGMLDKIDSKLKGKTDRSIKYEYDKLDRLVKVTYADNEVETFTYDSWGKLIASSRGDKKATFKYDYFGRMIEKNEGGIVSSYAYNPWGQRTARVTKQNGLTLSESKTYDEFGRLTEIKSNEKVVKYSYNQANQLIMQLIDGIPVEFAYTKYGQLESKILGGKIRPISTLKYFYAKDGMIAGRVVNDKVQMYAYDQKGQLLSVADMEGNISEAYKYDPAGNILSKNIAGKITTFTYDKANQLVTSAVDNKVTNYAYDAAGRLVKEGSVASGFKTYSYGYLDKILEVQENGEQIAAFDYHVGGQIASAVHGDKTENFLWDGLALIHRGDNSFINEPYVTGGNPILSSKDGVMFNDMLGTTLGIKNEKGFEAINMTAFGEPTTSQPNNSTTEIDKVGFFTGKPYIGELGYAFLFRNYRAELGKWQTKDPLGYPDGWNNLAYVNNWITSCIDKFGTDIYHVNAPKSVDTGISHLGHSAGIVGSPEFGYRIINHGSSIGIQDEYNTWDKKFSTLAAALAKLNEGRSGDEAFTRVQKWKTNHAQDDIAYGKMLEKANEDYGEVTNNCWGAIQSGIYEAFYPLGMIVCSLSVIPNDAFDQNSHKASVKVLDFDKVMRGLEE